MHYFCARRRCGPSAFRGELARWLPAGDVRTGAATAGASRAAGRAANAATFPDSRAGIALVRAAANAHAYLGEWAGAGRHVGSARVFYHEGHFLLPLRTAFQTVGRRQTGGGV